MKDILEEIIEHKAKELIELKKSQPIEQVKEQCKNRKRIPVSMRQALEKSSTGIIAEFKRKSPSKGWIDKGAKIEKKLTAYVETGAAACSILTDSHFFAGEIDDLISARFLTSLPLLRKDFIIDEYQLYQSYIAGADAILLIASCLSVEQCLKLSELSKRLGLEILLEIHHEEELKYLNPHIDMLGVNNRHLGTFHTDVAISFDLMDKMKAEVVSKGYNPLFVSESGISKTETVNELKAIGFNGFLIGENFMSSYDTRKSLTDFIAEIVCQ